MGTTPGHGGLAMQSKPTTSVLGLVLSPPGATEPAAVLPSAPQVTPLVLTPQK